MRKVKEAEVTEYLRHVRRFDWLSGGGGFTFPCDEHGKVNESALYQEGLDNFRKCLDGTYEVIDLGIESWECEDKTPALWICCETEFECDGFTNTCPDCGADYNWNGSLLASRSQWGEETGEPLSDILRIP
jgi:hypothetical protein